MTPDRKRILILGAGAYQVPLIRRARETGYWVAAASWSLDDPGMAIADAALVVDTTDKEGLLDLARRNSIDAVTTTGTDVAIPSIGHLCDVLNLPGINRGTADACSNKVLMQKRFSERGVPAAAHLHVATVAEALDACTTIGFPVVVKAPDSSGSRGVSVARDVSEAQSAFELALQTSRCGSVLVEELLVGEEFGAQVVVQDGEPIAYLFHNDTTTPPPVCVPIGHSCPCRLSSAILREASEVCDRAVKALGIQNAVCNADLIATERGVKMLEIGARIGATGIPEIVKLHYGVDLYDVALQMALGERVTVEPQSLCAAAMLIIRAPATGKLKSCQIPSDIEADDRVVQIDFDYEPGTEVREFRVGPDRIGAIFVVANDVDATERLVEEVFNCIEITMDADS